MNKRTASDIIKKFADETSRQEAVDLADKNGYTLNTQIEHGVTTLVSVYDDSGFVHVDGLTDDSESVEEATAKAATTPATNAPKKT